MTEQQSIREDMSETLFRFYDHGTQPNALVEADALLASPVIRRIQAEAIRDAATKAQEAYVAEQGGIGYARVRTDWLHEEADRIEKGGATDD